LLHLMDLEATRRGHRIDPERIQEASEQFRRSRGLLTASATRAWLEDNGMSKSDFSRLLELEVLAEDFLKFHTDAIDNLLVHELRRADEFSPILQALTEKKRLLHQRGITNPTLADTEAELSDVLNWYQSRVRPIESSLKTHARALGFESLRM